MKLLKSFVLTLAICVFLLLSAVGQELRPLATLSVSGIGEWLHAGEKCEVTFLTVNVSGDQIKVRRTNSPGFRYRDYSISLAIRRNGSDVAVPISPKFNANQLIVHSGVQQQQLSPGESERETIDLSQLFDLSEPGDYVLRVRRLLLLGSGTETIESNELKFRITPG